MKPENDKTWTTIIDADDGSGIISISEIWQYRDLILMFVKRNFSVIYKQTVLGPFWWVISPMLTTIVFTIFFGSVVSFSTEGSPALLFYMCGTTIWSLFSSCLTKTSIVLTENAGLFSKVYFPRYVTVLSSTISAILQSLIQLSLLLVVYIVYVLFEGIEFAGLKLLLLPLILIHTSILGMSMGTIITSLTAKYRDLAMATSLGVQLWMYATPIVYPLSQVNGIIRSVMQINPMTPIVEAFRFVFLGRGSVNCFYLGTSVIVTCVLFFLGCWLFTRTEKSFVDTI